MAEASTPAPTAPAPASSSAPAIATTKYVTSADVKWFVGTMAAVAVFSVTGAFALDARADEKIARAEARSAERLEVHERYESARLGDMKESLDRQEKKTDTFLAAFNVPNPAPAPAKDGGR